MTTYYTGSDNQRDVASMIYLRELVSGSFICRGIEIQDVETSDLALRQQKILLNLNGSQVMENDFGGWRDGRNEMFVMHPMGGTASILHNGQNLQAQGLSLSLEMLNSSSRDEQSRNTEYTPHAFSGANQNLNKGDLYAYGMSRMSITIPNSKYLKAAQQLLNEIVNVPKALKQSGGEKNQSSQDNRMKSYKEDEKGSKNVPSNQQE